MSKVLFLLSLVLLASCEGEQKPTPEDAIGEIRPLDPVRKPEDNDRVSKICAALRAKEGMMGVLVSQQYTFQQAQKGCSESKMPAPKNITTRIRKAGQDSYYFEALSGDTFSFANVETANDGVMKLICNTDVYNLESPLVDPKTNTAIYWTTFTDPTFCKSSYESMCVHIQLGTVSQNYTAKLHTNEWIKFKTADANVGFFTERYLVTKAGCGKKQTREIKATLK